MAHPFHDTFNSPSFKILYDLDFTIGLHEMSLIKCRMNIRRPESRSNRNSRIVLGEQIDYFGEGHSERIFAATLPTHQVPYRQSATSRGNGNRASLFCNRIYIHVRGKMKSHKGYT